MRIPIQIVALSLLTFLAPAVCLAQVAADLTGSWSIQAAAPAFVAGVAAEKGLVECTWSGTMDIQQNGGALSGDISMSLDPGAPQACAPDNASATFDATLGGSSITGGVAMGGLGEMDFDGTITAQRTPAAVADKALSSLQGNFTVTMGGFAGLGGTWSAQQLPFVLNVPTTSPLGLWLFALLLVAAALVSVRWRRA